MRVREVTGPNGRRWRVRRRWTPRLGPERLAGRFHRRFRGRRRRKRDPSDLDPSGCLDFAIGFEALAYLLAVALVILVAWFVFIPLVLAVVDGAIVIATAVLGLVGRLLLGRPWQQSERASLRTTPRPAR